MDDFFTMITEELYMHILWYKIKQINWWQSFRVQIPRKISSRRRQHDSIISYLLASAFIFSYFTYCTCDLLECASLILVSGINRIKQHGGCVCIQQTLWTTVKRVKTKLSASIWCTELIIIRFSTISVTQI